MIISNANLDPTTERVVSGPRLLCPFDLRVTPIARFLNCELVDHPVYDGLELQYFDDPVQGTGMLAFLSRRADRRVDYYHESGLTLDHAGFAIGGGTGSWTQTTFQAARLEVTEDGVAAEARFTDVDGRLIELAVDDRNGRRRTRGALLAPVSAGIDRPNALLLVWLQGFDLLRATRTAPVIRFDGRDVAIGHLPGARLHRRRLIKYAAPLSAVELNRNHDGPIAGSRGRVEISADGRGIAGIAAGEDAHRARLSFTPALPDLTTIPDGTVRKGRWQIEVDDALLTGGIWSAGRLGNQVELTIEVDELWTPGRLPLLMRLVTRLMPDFRRWPTTYRWTATVSLDGEPNLSSRWERTTADRGDAYRRVTGS